MFEMILIVFVVSVVSSAITYKIVSSKRNEEFVEYRTRISNDFRHLAEYIYSAYGTVKTEVVPEKTDKNGLVTPAYTQFRTVLENKKIAAAISDFQSSLYQ